MSDWLVAIIGFAVFASIHSLLASHALKRKLLNRFPLLSVWYRLIYNVIALTTLAIWALLLPVSHKIIYRIPFPFYVITSVVQLVALVAAWKTVRLFGSGRFLGTEQLSRYVRRDEIPAYFDENTRGTFIRNGLYKYVRHPLYTLSLAILVFWPVMTFWLVTVIILCASYFWIGSILEERKLVERFGDAYREYQKQVPRIIPNLTRSTSASDDVLAKDRTSENMSR